MQLKAKYCMGNSKASYCKLGPSESYGCPFLSDTRGGKDVGKRQAKVTMQKKMQAGDLLYQKESLPS